MPSMRKRRAAYKTMRSPERIVVDLSPAREFERQLRIVLRALPAFRRDLEIGVRRLAKSARLLEVRTCVAPGAATNTLVVDENREGLRLLLALREAVAHTSYCYPTDQRAGGAI